MSLLQNSNAIETSGSYNVNNSLRLRQSASSYLSRTPTNSNTSFTLSLWLKRGEVGTGSTQAIFAINTSNMIRFETNDNIGIYAGSTTRRALSTAVFRDPSAWYHVVIVRNGGQGGTTSVWTVYVNNQSVVTYTGDGGTFSSAVVHQIGRAAVLTSFLDAYIAEIHYVDGQALTPSSFAETNTTTGVWIPKAYTGTYGTNGFYLKFTDTSSVANLGLDSSGNGNTWTVNNVSLTAGTTYDAMTDVPTNTSETAANYPVFNVVDGFSDLPTFNSGNLTFVGATGQSWARSTMAFPQTGKWYVEASNPGAATTTIVVGLVLNTLNPTTTGSISTNAAVYGYRNDGNKIVAGTASAYGATWALATDVIGIAFDAGAGTLTMYKNNVSQGTLATGLTGTYYFVAIDGNATNTRTVTVNFGQRPFTYTPPTGFKALNTYNLPDSTIVKGNSYMDATTYTGTGASLSVTNAGAFRPDLVWIKGRSGATDNALYDFIRGTTNDLVSNSTAAATTQAQGLTAFNSDGFTVGTLAKLNTSAATYVGWQWAGSGASVSNTSGTITSTVDANTTAGFSVVTYTGTGANATVGHGLGVAPKWIIVKGRSNVDNWQVYHSNLTSAANRILLNTTASQTSQPAVWNSTAPTSSVFSLGTGPSVNQSSQTFVAYCWAEIAGFSAFGSYTGNGSADGPFVYLGFRPKFIIIKRTDTTSNWTILDTAREGYNVDNDPLFPNLTSAEGTTDLADILSNGFKLRSTDASVNASGSTYIYAAFAENPFKNSLAR